MRKPKTAELTPLPLRVPASLPELERAVMLLGNISRGERLRQKVGQQLLDLLGERRLPSAAQAATWKSALNQMAVEARASTAI